MLRPEIDVTRAFRVGPVRVCPRRGRLVGTAGEAYLARRETSLLCELARRPGCVFGRDELLASLWEEAHVSDECLTQAVYRLRRGLRAAGSRQPLVETVPKRGYRVSAIVTQDEEYTVVPDAPRGASANPLRTYLRKPWLPWALAILAITLWLGERVGWLDAQDADAGPTTITERIEPDPDGALAVRFGPATEGDESAPATEYFFGAGLSEDR